MDRNQLFKRMVKVEELIKKAQDFDSFLLNRIIRPSLNRIDALDIKLQAILNLLQDKKIFTEEEFKAAVTKSNNEFRAKTNEQIKKTATEGADKKDVTKDDNLLKDKPNEEKENVKKG